MKTSDRISRTISLAGQSAKSLAKVALAHTGGDIATIDREAEPLIIMGNGPSLTADIDTMGEKLATATTMAVNFAANAPQAELLRPNYYILADPHFFTDDDPNVARLWDKLNSATHSMTLFLPSGAPADTRISNPAITVRRFPMTGVSGFKWLTHRLMDRQWGMPRPRNVLIPAIMCGIWSGFRKIYIIGADHSWTRTLEVSDDNCVISIQPHFYRESETENKRVAAVYKNVHIHEILQSFSIAFAAYHDIAAYAVSKGVSIYNSTPGSFIDAFPRQPLPVSQPIPSPNCLND